MENTLHYLTSSLQNFQACRYLGLAGYIIYVYDFLLTYSEVQRLIWPSPMGVVKVCYYFNRIFVPIGLTINTWQMSGLTGPLSTTFCKQWIAVAGYMEVISMGVSNMILLLRVYALYSRSKGVLFGLLAFFFASYLTVLVTTTLSILAVRDHIIYSPLIKACIVDDRPPMLASIWAAPIAFEVLIFCMTMYKGIEHAKTAKSITNSPILYTLYRDGLVYFIVIIIVRLFNLLVWCLGDKSIILLGIYFIWGLVTALISRLLLNIRGVENSTRYPQDTSVLAPSFSKTEGSMFMQTGWFEHTRDENETIFTPTDNITKRMDDCWEEGMSLAAETNDIYLGSIPRKAFQRREQEMKGRRAIEREKWREERQAPPKYGPSYRPDEGILIVGHDDKSTGDGETIVEPTSARSEEFATVSYDPTLNDSYPDLVNLNSEQRHSHNGQRTHYRDDNQEARMIRESSLPSQRAFQTNQRPTLPSTNIEKLLLRTSASVDALGRSRSAKPGSMRMGNLPISPTPPNSRTSRFPPRNPPR